MARIHQRAAVVLLFADQGLCIASAGGQLRPSLGTAAIRLRHIAAGKSDPLIRAADLQAGDTIVDCTYGLGRDAVVAAYITGPTGEVIGIEASPALFHMANENKPLSQFDASVDIEPATVRIVHADARGWLRTAKAQSADIVLVDPMFAAPQTSDGSFAVLRTIADEAALSEQWVRLAQRVARRWVVVKSGSQLPWFDEIGLRRVRSHGNARWYRVAGDLTTSF